MGEGESINYKYSYFIFCTFLRRKNKYSYRQSKLQCLVLSVSWVWGLFTLLEGSFITALGRF